MAEIRVSKERRLFFLAGGGGVLEAQAKDQDRPHFHVASEIRPELGGVEANDTHR